MLTLLPTFKSAGLNTVCYWPYMIHKFFSYEDCDREAIDVPYLDTEEVCEDVEFEDCVDAEVQVPIKVE